GQGAAVVTSADRHVTPAIARRYDDRQTSCELSLRPRSRFASRAAGAVAGRESEASIRRFLETNQTMNGHTANAAPVSNRRLEVPRSLAVVLVTKPPTIHPLIAP